MGLLPAFQPYDPAGSLRDLYLSTQGLPSMSAPHSTLGQRLTDTISHGLQRIGMGGRQAQQLGGKIGGALEAVTPVGGITQGYQAGQDLRAGQWLPGAAGAALAMLPGAPKGMFGRAIRDALPTLPESSLLSMPRTPTVREMAALSRVDQVPLSAVRRGNEFQWNRFNSGDHGQPLVSGYSDHPLAAQLDNGEFVLLDGNHRAALAKQAGASEMPMHVIPVRQYDPQNAGRASKPPSAAEIDALLAGLTRP